MGTGAPTGASAAGAAWEALGTGIVLRVTAPASLAAARAAVEGELAAIDLACSRFRADSELTRLNAAAGRRTRVSPLLAEAIELALRGAVLTGGDVDPTVGRALELAGYDRDWQLLEPPGSEPAPAPVLRARVLPGWRAVALDRERGTVSIPAGVHLDLGASAKAWAADRAADAAASAGGCGALVAVGGDIAIAGPGPAAGWQVRVTDDHRSDASAPGQSIRVASGGVATSSTAVRRWRHEGATMHHIIDPRTGAPVRGPWRTVSVAAASCADANIAATAALVRGEDAPAWLASRLLPARLAGWRGELVTVAGWPAQDEPLGGGAVAGDGAVAGGGGAVAA